MINRVISSSGEKLPVLGLGTWQTFDVPSAQYAGRAEVLRRFVAHGGTLVDSSPMYGRAETAVGDLTAALVVPRPLFLATKVWVEGAEAGVAQMSQSLRRLRVTQVDLMQVHNLVDVDTHLRTLREWKAAGKVRYIGVTHYTVESHPLLETFLRKPEVDFVQVNYSLAVRAAEERLLPLAADLGKATLINRPFESGGMFRQAARVPLPSIARDLGCESWAQLFLKYVIGHPAVTCVIPATADAQHLDDNMRAAGEPLADAGARAELARAWDATVGR